VIVVASLMSVTSLFRGAWLIPAILSESAAGHFSRIDWTQD